MSQSGRRHHTGQQNNTFHLKNTLESRGNQAVRDRYTWEHNLTDDEIITEIKFRCREHASTPRDLHSSVGQYPSHTLIYEGVGLCTTTSAVRHTVQLINSFVAHT